jgi:hypothetical protein
MERRTESAAERAEREEIERSLKTSTYLTDHFWESIHSGIKPQTPQVPNYQEPTRGDMYANVASESQGEHMDLEGFYRTAANNMNPEQLSTAMQDVHVPREGDENTFASGGHPLPQQQSGKPRQVLSQNQASAVKKYPMLVEFLGRPEGEKIAKEISSHINAAIADIVHANSKEANECAIACKASKHNLREFFQGDGWMCRVTASGPFRGDEAIYYSSEKDIARILRKSISNGQVRYADITDQFNVIYELEEGEFPPMEETVETEAPESEEGENHEDEMAVSVADDTAS